MKDPIGTAKRWLEQARHDLESARNNLEITRFYSDACFMAEQASQKALKAYLISKGERHIFAHSVNLLAQMCREKDSSFAPFEEYGMILDKYYIPTRYPDALAPPAVPYKSYIEKEAKEAVIYAEAIIEHVGKISKIP